MTKTTDIASLVVDMRGRAITRMNNGGYAEISLKATDLIQILDQLEAEHQRADANAQEIKKLEFQWEHRAPTQWAYDQACTALHAQRERAEKAEASIGVLQGIIARKEFDALKGDQVPYAWVRISQNGTRNYTSFSPRPRKGNGEAIPLFTAHQKPVISKEKLCDWLEDNFDIDDSQRDAFAKCFAHHCNCIVKKEDE